MAKVDARDVVRLKNLSRKFSIAVIGCDNVLPMNASIMVVFSASLSVLTPQVIDHQLQFNSQLNLITKTHSTFYTPNVL